MIDLPMLRATQSAFVSILEPVATCRSSEKTALRSLLHRPRFDSVVDSGAGPSSLPASAEVGLGGSGPANYHQQGTSTLPFVTITINDICLYQNMLVLC